LKIRCIVQAKAILLALPITFFWGFFTFVAAADASGFTRESYDLLMRWVNFVILVVLIVKYARRPVMTFLKDKRNEISSLIDQYEAEKKEAAEKIRESQIQLEASQERLNLIKERIVAEGQRRKEQVIADAKEESRLLLDSARLKIKGQIREAYNMIRAELIHEAAQKALLKLPGQMTQEDHERLIQQWLLAVAPAQEKAINYSPSIFL
jgi:F-type H+-transporting ATPase subunit b